jgi:hypothetical protein
MRYSEPSRWSVKVDIIRIGSAERATHELDSLGSRVLVLKHFKDPSLCKVNTRPLVSKISFPKEISFSSSLNKTSATFFPYSVKRSNFSVVI